MNKYRLYCNDCTGYKNVIASSAPTVCPENAEHTIKEDSIVFIESVLVNDGTPTDLDLGEYKQLRYNEIDAKTSELISSGFAYDGKTFSLSIAAQMNWSELKGQESEFTWPVEISTKDNDAYSLAQANLTAFWTAGRDAVKGHLDSGRTLKASIHDAADKAAVDAVVDSR